VWVGIPRPKRRNAGPERHKEKTRCRKGAELRFRSPAFRASPPSYRLRATSVPELVTYAKANPEKISLGNYGFGTSSHVIGELFKMTAGINMVDVSYRGTAPMLTDLIGEQIQVAFDNLSGSIEHIRADKLRALAVTTVSRSPALPNIPTLGDFLPGFEASVWIAIGAPKNTPSEIIDKLNSEINAGLADPKIVAQLTHLGGTALTVSPVDLDKFVVEETEKWGKVVRTAGIKAE